MKNDKFRTKLGKFREEIIRAETERLLVNEGCRKFTIAKLADAVGVGKGTVYNHLPEEGSWVEAAVGTCSRNLLQSAEQFERTHNWRDRIDSLVGTIVEAASARETDRLGAPCCLMSSPCPHNGWAPVEDRITDLLHQGRELGEFSADCDLDLTAELLKYLVVAAVAGEEPPTEKKRRLQAAARLYLDGIVECPASRQK